MKSNSFCGSPTLTALRRRTSLLHLMMLSLFPGLMQYNDTLMANPQGGVVVEGNVRFGGGAGNLQILQNSHNAIINWDQFSIQAGELTQFRQPNANSAVLNRVTGGDPSAIQGALKANGNVFVINPNGILVGPSGTIDVNGLVLSTLDVSNGEFLARGDMNFKGSSSAGVTNMGRINAIGGDVFLIGRTVSNSGSVSASSGRVGLAAGEEVLLTASEGANGERMFVRPKGTGGDTGIYNEGTIEGAAVELKAHGNVYALAINNKGTVRATGSSNRGGRVYLRAAGGTVKNTGSIRASSAGAGSGGRVLIEAAYARVEGMLRAQGGDVRVTGTDRVEVGGKMDVTNASGKGGSVVVEGRDISLESTAKIDASGVTGGGNIQVGGGFQGRDSTILNADTLAVADGATISADALSSGSGGNVILWSDGDTTFAGSVSARGISQGGFAEISGKSTLEVSGEVDLTANSGAAGTLLLDPTNITISATGGNGLGGSTISNVWLSQQLDAGNNVVVSTNFGSGGAGNITVGRTDSNANSQADRIQWYQNSATTVGGTLTFLAMGNIYFNTAVQSAGVGGVNVVAGWDGSTGWSGAATGGSGAITFDMGAVLATMPGGINEAAADAAGLGGGSVFLGATNALTGVAVGSRWGATNVAARDLILRGSTSIGRGWAQLGFNDNGVEYQLSRNHNGIVINEWWGSAAGNVQSKNYIALLGGTEFGTGDTNTLGTKAFRGAGWGATGDITVGLSGRLDARGGTTASYTQIGHGGILSDGTEDKWLTGQTVRTTRDGIQIAPNVSRRSVFASTWRTNYAGDDARIDADIKITAAGDILLMGARGFDGLTDMQSTSVVSDTYSRIGHGGAENQGSYHGDITVEARGVTTAASSAATNNGLAGLGIQLLGGRGTRSHVVIGHGSGHEGNPQSIWDQTRSGDIKVTATTGAIRLQGHNQAIREGDINTGTIVAEGTPTPLGNASDNPAHGSFVQIGHGGQVSSTAAAGGTFIMPGGSNVANIVPNASMTGAIDVFAGGTYLDPENANTPIGILVRAGNRQWTYAMIGHGGTNHNANTTTVQTPNFGTSALLPFGQKNIAAATGFNGDISVKADQGSLIATGGDSFRSQSTWGFAYNFVRIGHGGDGSNGPKGGKITVLAGQGVGATAGDIRFTAGHMNREYAQIGHGGLSSGGAINGAAQTAEIIVTAYGSISFVSPEGGEQDAIGLSADYANTWYGDFSVGRWATADRYVMIGHGGSSSVTVMPNQQDIWVTAGTGDLKNADGNAATGGITFVAGNDERSFAQLGHGGYSSAANDANGFTGDIYVTANGGDLIFDATVLGRQGATVATDVSLNGSTTTRVQRGFGTGAEAYAQLGHGGYASRGVHQGDIYVDVWGGIEFLGAAAAPKVDRTVISAPIDAAISAGTNVWISLSNMKTAISSHPSGYDMPEALSNIVPGTIRIVLGDGSVITDVPRASSDDRATVVGDTIPNGLYRAGVRVGEVQYDNGTIRFNNTIKTASGGTWTYSGAKATFQTAQGMKERAYVQLGHGGYETDGPDSKAADQLSDFGNIRILAAGDIVFQGGAAHRNSAQLGHGGYSTRGAKGGDITIDHIDASDPLGRVGSIRLLAGYGGIRQFDYHNYAMIGHGGIEAYGNNFGNISIRGTQDVKGMGLLVKAGDRQDAFAMIGHGGMNSRTATAPSVSPTYGLNGNITVSVTGDVAFVAGTLTTNNPLNREDGRLFAQIGHGGYDVDAGMDNAVRFGTVRTNPLAPVGTLGAGDGHWGHFGDITLTSTGGNISFMAGSNIPLANRRDLNGDPIPVANDPDGNLVSRGDGKGIIHWAQAGHGGYTASGSHYGNITVTAENGSVYLVGGMMSNDNSDSKYNFAQIGHGGAEAQGHLGRTTDTISVRAGRDIAVIAGTGNRNQALIGNGGLNFDGSHTGTIKVYAGRDIQMRGGMASQRVVRRIGEYQEMNGTDGGAANDLSEFNAYYGSGTGGLGYQLMDAAAAAGNGQKTKLIGQGIQPGTVEFRLAIAAPTLFDANKSPEYKDDGNGNIIQTLNPSNIVGTINYGTGEVTWTTKILASNTANQPDLFVNYEHTTFIRNDAIYANATIGHGGYASGSRTEVHPETAVNGFVNRGISGAIDVRAGVNAAGAFNGSHGSIVAIAGNDQRTYVQIGHGGMDSATPAGHALSGAINVLADGKIDFRGGGGLVDLQHIAFNYYGTGGATVAAVTAASDADRVNPRYATALGAGTQSMSGLASTFYAFAHIGHGGVSAHANNGIDNNANNPLAASEDPATGHNGNIYVKTATGNIVFTGGGGGGGGNHFAQIGHGGTSSLGNHYGRIDVISGGDIVFTGGGESYRTDSAEKGSYVQIGHGGRSLTGNLSGIINVEADGEIRFTAGDGLSDRARVPYAAHVYTLNRNGDQDDNHFNRTESRQNDAQIGHGGFFVYGDKTGAISVTAGNGISFRGGDRLTGSLDNNAGYLNYSMIGHGGIQAWRQFRNNISALSAFTYGDDWNMPIWWNGTTYVMDGTFGPNGDGFFPWPSDNSTDPVKGTGKPLYDGFSGNITVTATGGDIVFSGGTAPGAFGQIGHGGIESGGDHNGDITVKALAGDINFKANRIEETGSNATSGQTYVQIGHGGQYSSGEQSGKITATASGEIRFKGGSTSMAYAMIGHGGREDHGTGTTQWGTINYRHSTNYMYSRNTFYRPGTRSGDIEVVAGSDIILNAGNQNSDYNWVMIGHGGYRIHANPDPNSQFGDGHNGNITVRSTGGEVRLEAGKATGSFVQIGHGGWESMGNHGGDVNDTTNKRTNSDILVEAATGITGLASGQFRSNTTAASYVQIGHGGRRSSFRDSQDFDANNYAKIQPLAGYTNPATGAVNVDDPGMHPLTPFLNNNDGRYLGGALAKLGTFQGDITLRTTGDGANIRFYAPSEALGTLGINGTDSYVMVGHGGRSVFGDVEGNITVDSKGDIQFIALQGKALSANVNSNHNGAFALLGHGGYESGGQYTGFIDVSARGSIIFQGSDSVNGANLGFAQIGHGGYSTWKGTGQYREAIRDPFVLNPNPPAPPAPTVPLTGSTGYIKVTAGGDLNLLAGKDNATYAQIGHGGHTSRDSHSGDITINVGGGITALAGTDYRDTDAARANFGENDQAFVMIGHGGYDSDGNHFGNINITANQNAAGMGLLLKAGDSADNFGQIGHGGRNSRSGTGDGAGAFGLNGNITINVKGDISIVAGTVHNNVPSSREDGRNWVMIGHGGWDSDPTPSGSNFFGQTGSTLPAGTAGAGAGNWGHFGDISLRTTQGNINVMGGSIIPVANRFDLDGNPLPLPADPNGVLISAGDGKGIYHSAMIGHGGYGTSGDHHGNITTIADLGSVNVVGGMLSNDNSAGKYNFAQIGHGGAEAAGHLGRTTETIKVYAGRDVVIAAGQGNRNQAHIGNGGVGFQGTHTGDIKVYAGRDIQMRGGVAQERVVRRIGEFQDMVGIDGGNANDIGEFNLYYGNGDDYSGQIGFGVNAKKYLLMDAAAAAGGGQKTKLTGKDIQPGTVEFRLAIAAPTLFDANKTPEYKDDGSGNIIETLNPSNVVGTIDYATGEVTWTTKILASNTPDVPDLFVNYEHLTGVRNDAIYASAQIGHGTFYGRSRTETHPETALNGFVNRGHQGNIDVRAGVNQLGAYNASGGSLIGIAGNDQRTYVQIGHGGSDALAPTGHGYSGTITTKADGSIVFRGGGGLVDNHYTGYNFYGASSTEVTAVTAAYDADRTSPRYATPLDAGGTRSTTGITDIVYAYAQIGHGGPGANANNAYNINTGDPLMPSKDPAKGHHGDVFVETAHGNIDFTAGGKTGNYHFAQIGHGGVGSSGNHYGEIHVNSGADINFTAGGVTYSGAAPEKRNYAMIGHGGFSMNGNLDGNVTVNAVGKIRFRGGEGTNDSSLVPYGAHVYVLNAAGNQDHNHTNRTRSMFNYALIGHGGEQVFGDKTGDITVTAGNGIDFQGGDVLASANGKYTNDGAYLNYAMIGHGGYRAVRQYRVNNTTPGLPAGAGNADDWDLPFWWDPVGNQYVFDGTFGPNGNGQFFWPSDNSIDPAKGLGKPLYDGFSGDIKVIALGGNITFSGGTATGTFAQIGHGGVETGGDHNGAITVDARAGDINFNSNRVADTGMKTTATYTFTHIGHDGAFSSGEQSGTIKVLASGKINFKGGTSDSYAMIGHGGRESSGTTVTNWGGNVRHSANFLYARNTPYRPGTRSGDISVTAGGDIAFVGGNANGDRAFVQIGHGGYNIHANPDPNSQFGDGHNGEIKVVSTGGGIRIEGGRGSNAHALIGHGGTLSFGNHGGDGNDKRLDSDILVQAKTGIDVMATGRFSTNVAPANFAQIGHGGRQSSFRDAQDIDGALYAKLQPYSATVTAYINPITGVVNTDDGGQHPLTPFTTNNDGLYLGGRLATLGTFMGDITVRTTDAGAGIRFIAPSEVEGTLGINGADSYVHLGHGGFRNFGDIVGDITVESGGGLEFMALQGKALTPNVNTNQNGAFAMLGHGGYESGGSFSGEINVTTHGNVLFKGADSINSANYGFVQLGHGGFDSSKAGGQYREAIRQTTGVAATVPGAASITDPNNRPVGNSGNITVTVLNGGNLEFLAGRDLRTYAQLGHGGISTRDTHTGNITVTVAGGIRFTGSVDSSLPSGDNSGTNEDSYAQLGHGGYGAHGSHNGNITVTAGTFATGPDAGRSLVFRSGDDVRNSTQIGHGGTDTVGYGTLNDAIGLSGDIKITAAGDILFVAGTISGRDIWDNNIGQIYTQIGHGGYNSDVDANRADVTGRFDSNGKPVGHHGDITVKSGGSIEFLAGDTTRAYEPSAGAGGGSFHYAQIGHGGYSSSGNHYGDITVKAGVDSSENIVNSNARVYVAGGMPGTYNWADLRSYAQLGHGGSSSLGNMGLRSGTTALNTIQVVSGGDVLFLAEGSGLNAYVMLGNGGMYARGDHAANIDVRAGGNVRVEAGNPTLSASSGYYNHYSWAGISATDSSTKTYSLDWAANMHVPQSGVSNTTPPDGVLGRARLSYNRIVPGSIKITIRNTPDLTLLGTLSDNGSGGLIADKDMTADFGDGLGSRTITAGTKVADIIYSLSGLTSITFLQDVNPGPSDSTANLAVEFQHWGIGGAFAQLGNGGYDADFPDGTTSANANMYNAAMTLGSMGNLTVNAGKDVVLKAGGGSSNYVQMGNGGMWNTGRNYGNITIGSASERVGGAVILQGGGGQVYDSADAYAQIGHGGRMAYGTNTGDISIYATSGVAAEYDKIGLMARAGTRDGAYAQVGHNGYGARSGTYNSAGGTFGMEGSSGAITVNVIGDVNVIAGVLNRGGATVAQAVNDGNLYAQIGQGGYDADVTLNGSNIYSSDPNTGHHGDITVISEQGSVNVLGGDDKRTFLPSIAPSLGIHDGWEVNGITRMEAYAGGRHHYAQIGNGGIYAQGNHWGNITVQAGFNTTGVQTGNATDSAVRIWGGRFVADQDDTNSYAMIGQGGSYAYGNLGQASDLTSVMAAGDVDLKGGDGVNTFAEIGNGGYAGRGDHQGDVQVFAGGNVNMIASQFSRTQTLGNGLTTLYHHLSTSNAGELNQNTDRAGLLQAVTGGNAAGVLSLRAVNGVIPGSVWVEIYSEAGTRIGTIRDDGTGALRVESDFTQLVGGVQLVAGQQVGTVNYPGSQLTFTTRVNPGTEAGAANVLIGLEHTRTERAYVQIGHGGFDADNPDGNTDMGNRGNVRVIALNGDITAIAGASSDSSIQIGHGGRSTRGANTGDVILRAGGNVEFTAKGEMDRSYIQVGHGGWDADGNQSGDVIVSAGSGSLETSLGMGRYNDLFDFDRDGTLDQVQFNPVMTGKGSVAVTGGTFTDSWVQIGHGGRSSGNTAGNASTMSGKVGVEAYSDITLQGGTATRAFVQVGHGGWEDTMNMSLSGNISVISQTGALGVLAGSGSEAYSLIGHGALRNSLAAGPSGTRTGHIYLEADNWNITPNGTTSLARIGHTSSNANNGVTAGNRFTMYGNGGGGTTSYAINSAGYSLIGAQDHLAGGGDVTFAAQGDLSLDAAISANSAGKVNLLATGNLGIRQRIQNAGTGSVSAVGGWDGHTGMSGELPSGSLDFVVHVPERTFNIAPVLADKNSWGNNNGGVRIGDGTQTSGAAVGSAKGDTTVLGYEVALRGSDTTGNGFAQIGATPASGVSPSGDIIVRAKEGGIEMEGGSVTNAYTQIGHRALGAIVPTLSGAISVESDSDLVLQGGSGAQTSSQIGHGGPGATVNSISGDVTVNIVDDIQATGGTGGGAYVQIGHGGSATKGAMSGAVNVTTGGNLELLAPHISDAAYAKIGHGDDLRGSFAANGGTGTRDGAVVVSADGDITMEAGQIGHVGASSPATQGTGATTWIGVARNDPEDPTSGSIIADGSSQFAGSQVRIYLPERQNNQVAPGAWIAGTVYGGVKNPWPVQQSDEYTNYIETLDGSVYQPGQHDNSLGDGPVPVSGYAFYYNMIELAAAPPVPPTPPTPQQPTHPTIPLPPFLPAPDYRWSNLDDRTRDAWLRYQEAQYTESRSDTGIYYEGFSQYGPNGESIYHYGFSDAPSLSADEEDVLRRHLRHLDEATEQGGTSAPQAGTGGE